MRSSWRRLAPLLAWLLALFVAVAPATAKSASREKFSDTLEYRGEVAAQLVEASGENCLYSYDFASGDSFYNYFRDYNPATGRYQQSDPIGLKGGYNTYAYVGLNPLRYFDRVGLARGWKPKDINDRGNWNGCEAAAKKYQKMLGGGQICEITPQPPQPSLGEYRGCNPGWAYHHVVVKDDRVYDSFTGGKGEPKEQYKNRWKYRKYINFGF